MAIIFGFPLPEISIETCHKPKISSVEHTPILVRINLLIDTDNFQKAWFLFLYCIQKGILVSSKFIDWPIGKFQAQVQENNVGLSQLEHHI